MRLELENERAKKLVAEAGDMSALREQIASLTEELQSVRADAALMRRASSHRFRCVVTVASGGGGFHSSCC